MKPEEIDLLQRGERIYRWVWTGGDTGDIQELTVVRVNRVTVTVDNASHGRFRLPHHQIEGRVDWETSKGVTGAQAE